MKNISFIQLIILVILVILISIDFSKLKKKWVFKIKNILTKNQEKKDLNLWHLVLKTTVLPAELFSQLNFN